MKSKLNQILILALCAGILLSCTFEGFIFLGLAPRYEWSLLCMVTFIDVAWLWVAKDRWQKNNLNGYGLLIINLLAAGSVFLGNNPQLIWLVYLMMPLGLALQSVVLLTPAKEQFLNGKLPGKLIRDMFVGCFGKMGAYFGARHAEKEDQPKKDRKTLKTIIIALLCVFPFAAIALALLSSADAAFGNLLEKIWIIEDFESLFFSVFWGVTAFFLALSYFFYHSKSQEEKKEDSEIPWEQERKPLRLPALFTTVFLLVMNVIYTTFSVIQFLYVFSGNTPENVTLSEYVVSGFWQLIFLTVMNIVLLAVAIYFTDRKNAWGQKLMSLLLVVNNGIMGVSAFVRLSNYENAYGFTLTRLYGYFLLILIGVLLLLCIVKICCNRFPLRNAMFWATLIFTVCVLFFPTNRFVAEQNVNRYLQNPEKSIDVSYLYELGEQAQPAIERLKQEAPEVF